MTAKLAALQRLHDAVVEGSATLYDFSIWRPGLTGTKKESALMLRAYNGSLDAAKALHEALVPGWAIDRMAWWPGGHWAFHLLGTGEPDHNGDRWHGHADGHVEASDADPARSWLIAIIKALMAQEGE